jgi:hypothetical protein
LANDGQYARQLKCDKFPNRSRKALALIDLLENEDICGLAQIVASISSKCKLDVLASQPVHFKLSPVRMVFIYRTQQTKQILSIKLGNVACFSPPHVRYHRVIVSRLNNPYGGREIEGSEPISEVSSENDTNARVSHWKAFFGRGSDVSIRRRLARYSSRPQ